VDLLISEEMLLLALDNEKGGASWLDGWAALSGGVLVDALLSGAVVLDDERLRPGATEPTHPLLRRVREAVQAEPEPRTPTEWVQRLHGDITPFLQLVAQRLVETGVLTEERHKILGLIPTTRFPEADPTAERQLRARLRSVLVDGAEPDEHDRLLIALVQPAGLLATATEDDDREVRRAARKRGADLAEQTTHEPTAAVTGAMDARAVVAAVLATVAATTAATSAATIIAASN
jgi:hypothetical protein